MIRAGLLAFVALVAWSLARACDGRPEPRGADAPATVFSAGRAEDVLARILGPEVPHPVSSPEAAAVRDRIVKEFATLGITASVIDGSGGKFWHAGSVAACATVKNVVAEIV